MGPEKGYREDQMAGGHYCGERLTELGLFSLDKSWLQGDLPVAFQYLKAAYRQEGNQLFTLSDYNRTFEWIEEKFG